MTPKTMATIEPGATYEPSAMSRSCLLHASEAQVAVLADMSDRLLYQFEKQLDQQDAMNIALAQYACPGCGKTNLSATLVPPIGAGLGCGCRYHTPIDLD